MTLPDANASAARDSMERIKSPRPRSAQLTIGTLCEGVSNATLTTTCRRERYDRMIQARARAQAAPAADSDQQTRTGLSEILFWAAASVLAFVVPLCLVLAAVFVSSWGIPLPFYVAVP